MINPSEHSLYMISRRNYPFSNALSVFLGPLLDPLPFMSNEIHFSSRVKQHEDEFGGGL